MKKGIHPRMMKVPHIRMHRVKAINPKPKKLVMPRKVFPKQEE